MRGRGARLAMRGLAGALLSALPPAPADMDHYGPEDQNALPRALARLYARRESMLRPGHSYTVLPSGAICAGMTRAGLQTVLRQEAPNGEIYPPAGSPPAAHLPFGFGTVACDTAQPPPIQFLAEEPVRGRPTPVEREHAQPMRPASFAVPRDGFDEFGAGAFVDGIIAPVWAHEDRACVEALSLLQRQAGGIGLEAGSTLTGLCAQVRGAVDPATPPFMRPDTAFIGSGLLGGLGPDEATAACPRPAPNMIDHVSGLRVLAHDAIPDDAVYAISSARGPVFVSGPTEITCTDDAFVVARYCEVISPRLRRHGQPPHGFCAGVRAVP